MNSLNFFFYGLLPRLYLIKFFLIFFLLSFFVSLFISIIKGRKVKYNKHSYKIKQADKVHERLNIFKNQYSNAQILTYLRKIDPYVFEELLLTAFQKKGFRIERNLRYSGDGGFDGIIFNQDDTKIYIQAKRYKNTVSTAHILNFSQLIANNNASGGYFIHTGRTPKETLAKSKEMNIVIISGSKLIELIKI